MEREARNLESLSSVLLALECARHLQHAFAFRSPSVAGHIRPIHCEDGGQAFPQPSALSTQCEYAADPLIVPAPTLT